MLDRLQLATEAAFQDFCSILFSRTVEGFQAVDGSGGDRGNDGFLVSGDTLFQMYGPDKPTGSKTRKKIADSLAKGKDLRATQLPGLRRLCFVTPFDLGNDLNIFLQEHGAATGFAAESWGQAKLLGLLAQCPDVRRLFADFLVPDVFAEIQALRDEVSAALSGGQEVDRVQEILGPDYHPDIYVLQNDENSPYPTRRAYEYLRARVYAPGLHHDPFEPSEEEEFLHAVHQTFSEDANAVLEAPDSERVLVEHRDSALRFHRRWGWWCDGTIGMAATLTDLNYPGHYSAAEVVLDLWRLLQLAVGFGKPQWHARIVFEIDPHQLAVHWAPSDKNARDRLNARLGGIQSVSTPKLERGRPQKFTIDTTLPELGRDHLEIATKLVISALRNLHGARIDSRAFVGSVGPLVSALAKARTM